MRLLKVGKYIHFHIYPDAKRASGLTFVSFDLLNDYEALGRGRGERGPLAAEGARAPDEVEVEVYR